MHKSQSALLHARPERRLEPLSLLQWLPSETLFSLCCRLHRFWGFPNPRDTASRCFGEFRKGVRHDLPGNLDQLVARTQGAYGTASEIALGHTLLGYYRPFVSRSRIKDAMKKMRTSSFDVRPDLGVLTGNLRNKHAMKACLHCIESDTREHGFSYWHQEHQFPGVWICLKHDVPLRQSLAGSTYLKGFHWTLPSDCTLRPPCWMPIKSTVLSLRLLAQTTIDLVRCPNHDGWLSALPARRTLAARLSDGSHGSRQARTLRLTAADDYLQFAREFYSLPGMEGIPQTTLGVARRLTRFMRFSSGDIQPLLLLSLLCWKFQNSKELGRFISNH